MLAEAAQPWRVRLRCRRLSSCRPWSRPAPPSHAAQAGRGRPSPSSWVSRWSVFSRSWSASRLIESAAKIPAGCHAGESARGAGVSCRDRFLFTALRKQKHISLCALFYRKARHHSFIPSIHRLLNSCNAALRKHAILVTWCNVCPVKWQRVTWRNLWRVMASELFLVQVPENAKAPNEWGPSGDGVAIGWRHGSMRMPSRNSRSRTLITSRRR